MGFAQKYIHDTRKISEIIDPNLVEEMAEAISNLKKRGGRLFLLAPVEELDMQVMLFVTFEKFQTLNAIRLQIMFQNSLRELMMMDGIQVT